MLFTLGLGPGHVVVFVQILTSRFDLVLAVMKLGMHSGMIIVCESASGSPGHRILSFNINPDRM
jgi:hypothetical protein